MKKRFIFQLSQLYTNEDVDFLNKIERHCQHFQEKKKRFEGFNPNFYDLIHTGELMVGDIVNPFDEVKVYELVVNGKSRDELRSEYVQLFSTHHMKVFDKAFVLRLIWELE